jgi:predicted metal-dependent phosphoesterase TrpH
VRFFGIIAKVIKMKVCDLHSHSVFSDGSMTPAELVALAEKSGISALALTDHNTAKGLPDFMSAGEKSNIITVPGCEISTEHRGTELHILGLFLPENAWRAVDEYTLKMKLAKKESNLSLIKKLKEAGYSISYEEIAKTTDADEFNRAHVANVLKNKGYVKTVNEAFNTVLNPSNGYYVHPKRLDSLETVSFIKSIGGVAVLAHPFLNMNKEQLEEFLPLAKEKGLDGIETLYTTFSAEEVQLARELARRFGLKESGGSDFHGLAKPTISLGTGYGKLRVPFDYYEKLKP